MILTIVNVNKDTMKIQHTDAIVFAEMLNWSKLMSNVMMGMWLVEMGAHPVVSLKINFHASMDPLHPLQFV